MSTQTAPAPTAKATEIVYVNGEYVAKADAKVSVFDHGLLYGDGVFEGIRFYNRNVFRLNQHIDRLFDCAKVILLNPGVTKAEMAELTLETCRRNGLDNGYIRLLLTRGVGNLGISPFSCEKAGIIIIAGKISLYPEEYYTKGLSICTSSIRRTPVDSFNPRVKSLNYLNNVMAKIEAHHNGCLEAIMLDHTGYIVECTGDNFFLIKDDVLYTPPTYQGALRGITRDTVIELAQQSGMTVREERLTTFEAYTADEVFLTGTAAEIIPVVSIDKRVIGDGKPGPHTLTLKKAFMEVTAKDGVKF